MKGGISVKYYKLRNAWAVLLTVFLLFFLLCFRAAVWLLDLSPPEINISEVEMKGRL
jgi:hypothetical protein